MQVLSLQEFQAPRFDNVATVGLVQGVPRYSEYVGPLDESQPLYAYLRDYPAVTVTNDMLVNREALCTTTASDLFLPVQDSLVKKIASVWREKGFSEAVRFAVSMEPENLPKAIQWITSRLKFVIDITEKGLFQREQPTISIADIVPTQEWDKTLIRCMSWHPHCARLAVATKDDRIRVFSQGILGLPVLRHGAQKLVCSLSWRPYTGKILAAACHKGVLVWTIELGAASNTLSHAILLKQTNHAPVTNVAWHPQGHILVSCSPNDSSAIIWDVSREEGVPLKRVAGGGLCLSRWSPCGSRLFTATCGNIFRVWLSGIPTPWSADRWTVPCGRVAAACFGPNLTLLFASTEDPVIYFLPLQKNIFNTKASMDDVNVAVQLIDLAEVSFESNDSDEIVTVGGRIVALEWDPSGRYLGVLFKKSPLIALIKTKINELSRLVEVKPACFIKGLSGEIPNCINFYQKHSTQGDVAICLTIAWSSGRVQHFLIIEDESAPVNMTSSFTLANDLSLMSSDLRYHELSTRHNFSSLSFI